MWTEAELEEVRDTAQSIRESLAYCLWRKRGLDPDAAQVAAALSAEL